MADIVNDHVFHGDLLPRLEGQLIESRRGLFNRNGYFTNLALEQQVKKKSERWAYLDPADRTPSRRTQTATGAPSAGVTATFPFLAR